jgi:DNA-binding MarR family transcriptional regulator
VLAQDMGMDRSTLSRALKPLMAAGWVETVDLPEEVAGQAFLRPATLPAGRAKLEARPRWRRAQDEIDRRLGPKLAREFNDLIEDAYARLQDA